MPFSALKFYLSYEDFTEFFRTPFPNDQADLLAKGLKHHIIFQNNAMYLLQENISYQKTNDFSTFYDFVTRYLRDSKNNLAFEDQVKLSQDIFGKHSKLKEANFYSNVFVKSIYDQLKTKLTNKDIKFDYYKRQIHFNNGYYDMNKNTFSPRQRDTHYVTEYIQRDYKPSTPAQQNKIKAMLFKTYPVDDFKCIATILGSALTGECTKDQTLLFLLGQGSSGKSVVLLMTQKTVPTYFKEFPSNTFTKNNPNVNKILNSVKPYTLLAWVNEMDTKRADEDLIKKACDGTLQVVKLYQDESHDVQSNAKYIVTAQYMIDIGVDSGSERRMVAYTHGSKFIDNPEQVNDAKRVYLKDKNFLERFENEQLQDAWFDILMEAGHDWLQEYQIPFTANFIETKAQIIQENSPLHEFIEQHLDITENPGDRIGKKALLTAFLEIYPEKKMEISKPCTLTRRLKDILQDRLVVDDKKRADSEQGCYVGMKMRSEATIAADGKPRKQDVNITMSRVEWDQLQADNKALKVELERLRKELEMHITPPDEVTSDEGTESDKAESVIEEEFRGFVDTPMGPMLRCSKCQEKMARYSKEDQGDVFSHCGPCAKLEPWFAEAKGVLGKGKERATQTAHSETEATAEPVPEIQSSVAPKKRIIVKKRVT